MLRWSRGLSPEELEAIAELEERVVAHDGGRLKLEWGQLRGRSGERVEDVLAFGGDRLIGFAGLYGPPASPIEIAGMVDPGHRRRGLGSALLDAALALGAEAGIGTSLLIVPRSSDGGLALAAAHDATLDHSEHALVLRGDPGEGPSDSSLGLRTAQTADVADLMRILSAGFGYAPADMAQRLVEPDARTLVAEQHGRVVATLRVTLTGAVASVHGFAVEPALRGRGIGRDVLRRACRDLRSQGALEVGLEVEVDNDRALGLYASLGFRPVITEDYWAIAV